MSFGGLYPASHRLLLVAPDYLERVEILQGPGVHAERDAALRQRRRRPSISCRSGLARSELNRATASYATAGPVRRHHRRRSPVRRRRGSGVSASTASITTAARRSIARPRRWAPPCSASTIRGDRLRACGRHGYQEPGPPIRLLRATYVAAGVPVPLAPGWHGQLVPARTFQGDHTDLSAQRRRRIRRHARLYGVRRRGRAPGRCFTRPSRGLRHGDPGGQRQPDRKPRSIPRAGSQANTEEVGVRGPAVDTGPIRPRCSRSTPRA